ncbi:hypothetical protein HN789_02605 [archaeon]|jgi:DNA replication initiation complex subunit (GINS family)|nr:hypothetical protein [archaeon]MBT4021948.1 hypothetical protein [archaeon]MBT4272265.1 hypothetical protein [archaeon]MBT4460801.1 hypothetical protein [archaeon]MBT4858369.1 hypothetical protein [archaeon]
MGDIITYENLYEVVRKEKSSDALQKLNSNVISQMTDYLRTKIQVYKEAKQKNLPDLEKIRTQVLSARRLIKNLYELRERKIVNLSVTKSRAKSNLEEEENLLDYEKQLLGELCNNITKLRKTVLLNLLNAKTPGSEAEPNKNTQESKPVQNVEEKKLAEVSKEESKQEVKTVMIRFTNNVPKFLGKQMEVYGPFKPGDIANLDIDIVNILIKKEVAEIIVSDSPVN